MTAVSDPSSPDSPPGDTSAAALLAIDVGGTKLAVGLVTTTGQIVRTSRTATPVSDDPEVLWAALTALTDTVIADSNYVAVGTGCGGPMRWPEGDVSPVNIPAWRNFPLLERIRERYAGNRPAVIHNDAVALALGESLWGAGRGMRHVLGLVVSTGVGGGLVIGGRTIDGSSGNAGHIGHVVVDPQGPKCGCGGRGCLEAIARGPAIAAYAVTQGWAGEATARAVAEGARAGDSACVAAYDRAGRAAGIAVASTAALLDLDVVTIGGGVAQAGDLLMGPLREAFAVHAGMDYVRRCRIVPAGLGSDAGVIGAAALVLDELRLRPVSRYWSTDWAETL